MIPKRLFWFTTGVVCGVVGSAYTYARVREARGSLTADRLADTVAGTARAVGGSVREAYVTGRDAMREAEARIQADLDRR